jgi:hypothetical protein
MLLDNRHPFFRPLWRRVLTVLVCLVWSVIEFATGAPFWGTIAIGLAGYGVWALFITYEADETH